MVRTRLDELLAIAPAALEPAAAAAQHDLRIAAKRLRYLLELFAPCFGEAGAAARDAARRLQGVLGDIHDCDVMLPRAAGIESLQALLRGRRERLFGRFRELWAESDREGVWTALRREPAGL